MKVYAGVGARRGRGNALLHVWYLPSKDHKKPGLLSGRCQHGLGRRAWARRSHGQTGQYQWRNGRAACASVDSYTTDTCRLVFAVKVAALVGRQAPAVAGPRASVLPLTAFSMLSRPSHRRFLNCSRLIAPHAFSPAPTPPGWAPTSSWRWTTWSPPPPREQRAGGGRGGGGWRQQGQGEPTGAGARHQGQVDWGVGRGSGQGEWEARPAARPTRLAT